MRSRKKKWAEPFMAAHAEYFPADFAFLKGQNPLYLEIGCGKGDFALALHSKLPGCYLAIDRDHSVLATAGRKAFDAKAMGIYFAPGDFDFLGPKFAEEGLRFKTIFVNFPDPWPKKRHHKRRLIQPDFVHLLSTKLIKGGYIYLVTDWEEYAQWMMDILNAEPMIRNRYEGFASPAVWRPETKFERKGLDKDYRISELWFERV